MTHETGGGASGPRAGFGARLLAFLVDGILLTLVGLVLRALLGPEGANAVGLVLGLGYYVYFEGSPSGQTVGKHLLNIRVLDAGTGTPIGHGKALVRYLGKILSTIPCFLGFLWMLWDRENQTWHDKLAGSLVVPTSAYPVDAWPG